LNGAAAIALDGPVASGKTAVGRHLAKKLGYRFLDTGIMYRAITWVALEAGIDPKNTSALATLAQDHALEVACDSDAEASVLFQGQDVTPNLRTPEVARAVSLVSLVQGVRDVLVGQQRRIAEKGSLVIAGRDIGTVVLPDAQLKVFLTASVDERARRRHAELQSHGLDADLEDVKKGLQERDRLDSEREVSPLRPASDARVVVTDGMEVAQVADLIVELARRK
jgi:cytidylate kinase